MYVCWQDLGNLNVTVFSGRGDYDRPRNLQLVCSALNERWNTNLSVNKCNDIICKDTWKVSKKIKCYSYLHSLMKPFFNYYNTSILGTFRQPTLCRPRYCTAEVMTNHTFLHCTISLSWVCLHLRVDVIDGCGPRGTRMLYAPKMSSICPISVYIYIYIYI